MDRITEKNVKGVFEIFIKNIGGRIAKDPFDHNAYRLDYNGVYGGYNIEQIMPDNTGVRQPFGCERHKAREMFDMLRFANDALSIVNAVNATDKSYTVEEQDRIGDKIGSIFSLRRTRDGRYPTTWGDKTAVGLFNTVLTLADKINKGAEISE